MFAKRQTNYPFLTAQNEKPLKSYCTRDHAITFTKSLMAGNLRSGWPSEATSLHSFLGKWNKL